MGQPLGSFVESYVQRKDSGWVHKVDCLSSIAVTQPHTAYAAFTHGLQLINKWIHQTRTIPDIADLLQPLECAIRQRFLPSLTGQNAFNDADRYLLVLPVYLGGLGISNACHQNTVNHSMSEKIMAPLILQQSQDYTPEAKAEQLRVQRFSRIVHRQ